MKKIIMAVAAIAMVASMFAADIGAGTRINSTLFKFDGGSGNITLLSADNGTESYANPNFSFNVSGEKSGGSMCITTSGGGDEPKMANQQIWFKPLDMLKVTVGNWSTNLNQETIGWCNTETGIDRYGFALSLNIDAFGADVFFAPGNDNTPWLTIPTKGGDATVNDLYLKAGYSADFGTINGMFDLNTNNGKDKMRFGVGYKGSFAPVNTLFVNAIGYMNGAFAGIRGEVFADVGLDGGIGIKAFVPVTFVMSGEKMFMEQGWHKGGGYGFTDNQLLLGTLLRFSFPLGSFGAYVQLEENDWLAKSFALDIIPGVTGNMGAMSWEAQLKVSLSKPETGDFGVTISVPVAFMLNF